MSKTIDAWYFSNTDKRLRYGDGRDIAIGVTHTIDGPLELCARGLHASECALDALNYAPGPVIWKVRLSGDILRGDDKHCATERTYLAGGVDITGTLRAFARRCALDVVHLWYAPRVVRQYLETGDESIRAAARDAARDAAWNAARDAARDAAWNAARDAAWGAARVAAWNAARDAAWDAARDAARAAAWNAARDAAWDAARDAAWDAARAAAWNAQRKVFNEMVEQAIKEAS